MVHVMKGQVITSLTSTGLTLETLGNTGLYVIEVADTRVKAALNVLQSYEDRCARLSKAAELGMFAMEAAQPMDIATDVQSRFSELENSFRCLTTSLESSVKDALHHNFQVELDKVFKEGGTLEQRVRALVSNEGALARTLQEKGVELTHLFDPSNQDSFIARFESLLSNYLSTTGSLAKLFSPEQKGSYADRLNMLFEEYFGSEAGRIKQLLDPNVSTSPFGKIKSDMETRQNTVNQHMLELIAETKAGFSGHFEGLKANILAIQTRVEGYTRAFEEKAKRLEEAEQHMTELEAAKRKQAFYAGNSFEARIVDFLQQFARPRRDRAIYTGNTPDNAGKIGDIVYKLNLDGEWKRRSDIALEVRNRTCSRSGKSAFFLDDLEAAMRNRQCEFGIVVACLDKNANNSGKPSFDYLHEFEGNRFVVLVDEEVMVPIALEATLHLISRIAKFRGEAEQQDIDTQRINGAIASALSVVAKFRALKANLTTSITNLTTIRQSVDEMEQEVDQALREAQNEVKKALQGKSVPMTEIVIAT